MKGMIVYSFAWRKNGHSPCNVRLAEAAQYIITTDPEHIIVFAQRSTAEILANLGIECIPAEKYADYEGSEEVTDQAAEIFRKQNIDEVIPIAQPCLHLTKCIRLVRKKGFSTPLFWTLVRKIGWIGFDPLSAQPLTRGPVRLLYYTIRQLLFGYRLPTELSEP